MPSAERVVWKPDRPPRPRPVGPAPVGPAPIDDDAPAWTTALARGVGNRCPLCGRSTLFVGYLLVRSHCTDCGAALAEVPADDAPPWVTIFLSLHVLIGLVVALDRWSSLGIGATVAIVLPVSLALCLLLLRPVKGGVIAVLLKLGVRREDQAPP